MRRIPRSDRKRRRAMVLIIVLIAVAALSLAALAFSALMVSEREVVVTTGRRIQATALAESGIEAARLFLSEHGDVQYSDGEWYEYAETFQGIAVLEDDSPQGRGRFAIVAPLDDSSGGGVRFGLECESAKLNLNTLLEGDDADAARERLLALPGMTEETADSILDWLDEDDEPREFGAEAEYYETLDTPYRPANGPLRCLEELLFVRGVTAEALYGADRNRNGRIDADESDTVALAEIDSTGTLSPQGWSAYFTLYSREKITQPDGSEKIDLNQDDAEALYSELEEALGSEWATFIVGYRQQEELYQEGSEQDSQEGEDSGETAGGGTSPQSGGSGFTPGGSGRGGNRGDGERGGGGEGMRGGREGGGREGGGRGGAEGGGRGSGGRGDGSGGGGEQGGGRGGGTRGGGAAGRGGAAPGGGGGGMGGGGAQGGARGGVQGGGQGGGGGPQGGGGSGGSSRGTSTSEIPFAIGSSDSARATQGPRGGMPQGGGSRQGEGSGFPGGPQGDFPRPVGGDGPPEGSRGEGQRGDGSGGSSRGGGDRSGGSSESGGEGEEEVDYQEHANGQLDLSKPLNQKLESLLDLIGKRIKVTYQGSERATVVSPLFPDDPEAMREYLPQLMDCAAVGEESSADGRVNVNLAPAAVLAGVPGIGAEKVEQIIGKRPADPLSIDTHQRHPTWLLIDGLVTLDEMKELLPRLTSGGSVYRVQAVGFFDQGGPVVRIEAVIDAVDSPPRVLFLKELTPLGAGFDPLELGAEGSSTPVVP